MVGPLEVWTTVASPALVRRAREAFARFDGLVAAMPERFAVASICKFAADGHRARELEGSRPLLGDRHGGRRKGPVGFWSGQFLMHQGIERALDVSVDDALAAFDRGKEIYTGIGGRSAVSTFEASLAMNVARRGPPGRRPGPSGGGADRAAHLPGRVERAHRAHGRGRGRPRRR